MLVAAAFWLLAEATLPRRAVSLASLVGLVIAAGLALVLPPQIALALGLALLAPALRARVRGMMGALMVATAALLAGVVEATLGLLALGVAFWEGSESRTEQVMLAVAGIVLAAMPLEGLTFALRASFLAACLITAMLFRRPVRQSAIGGGTQRLFVQAAAALPAVAVAALLFFDGHVFSIPADGALLAVAVAAGAVALATAGAIALLGLAILFSTQGGARALAAGGMVAAALGVPMLGAAGALMLLLPALLGLAVALASPLVRPSRATTRS